ncbi:MAG TPA: type II toxin-antitoxin system VapC family toxin [Caulobacteraceae bacterium]|nr:type II toxin-antitoxin system VapC family toxin [Caulobacteraceae bacterium]
MIFVDASAICAILLDEEDARTFTTTLVSVSGRWTSPVAVFETVRALMRVRELHP